MGQKMTGNLLCEIARQRHFLQCLVAHEMQEAVQVQVWMWNWIPVGQFPNIILCNLYYSMLYNKT